MGRDGKKSKDGKVQQGWMWYNYLYTNKFLSKNNLLSTWKLLFSFGGEDGAENHHAINPAMLCVQARAHKPTHLDLSVHGVGDPRPPA